MLVGSTRSDRDCASSPRPRIPAGASDDSDPVSSAELDPGESGASSGAYGPDLFFSRFYSRFSRFLVLKNSRFFLVFFVIRETQCKKPRKKTDNFDLRKKTENPKSQKKSELTDSVSFE